ncbi:cytochrome c5 family protein [Aliiglaciecola sp. CAU 1673]|uniref:c-type cytochrome n=1 Tax=Aliiglaciecola sp. CAU 1673 TaxID=3032595 RepID=UPI0023DBCEF4|nr:cytochrome c5 family protein [Aliiglaciecola sp. CAU 1673]MDF2177916.1 cytochrome c5 family protein [Aliiglaciecola sp. CAU 1673]
MITLLAGLSLALALAGQAAQQADNSNEAIKERIKPVGQVRVAGAEAQTASTAGGARSGADVYGSSCIACHGPGVLGAPKVADPAWKERLEKGMDTLLQHALDGFNAMPPRGTCSSCSDDEIKAAIEHMIEGV